jgi:hypothetical protein
VFGARPGNLHFEPSDLVLVAAANFAAKDLFFRLALRDYARAITDVMDCALYCYRAIESVR